MIHNLLQHELSRGCASLRTVEFLMYEVVLVFEFSALEPVKNHADHKDQESKNDRCARKDDEDVETRNRNGFAGHDSLRRMG